MGWSVYVLDNANKIGFEIGEKWACGFPAECLLTKETAVAELKRRLPDRSEDALDELANNAFLVAQHAGFDVRIVEGPELPEGFKYVGGFWNGVFW